MINATRCTSSLRLVLSEPSSGLVQVRYLVVVVPLLCAGGWTLSTGPSHAADPASALVWAASIAGFVYLARTALSSNPNLAEQIDDAAGRLKDQLASSDVLKKAIGALTVSQQTAVENVKQAEERTKALLTELQRMKGETREAVAAVLAERDLAQRSQAGAVAGLQEAYCTVWRLAAQANASPVLRHLATEFEEVYLAQIGVTAINEVGVVVESKLHRVVEADEQTDSVPPGSVLRVVRPGFQRGGEVFERAEVVRARAIQPAVNPVAPAVDQEAEASWPAEAVPTTAASAPASAIAHDPSERGGDT